MSADDKQQFWRRSSIDKEIAKNGPLLEQAFRQLERELLWDIWQAGFYTGYIQREPVDQEHPHLVVTSLGLRRFDAR